MSNIIKNDELLLCLNVKLFNVHMFLQDFQIKMLKINKRLEQKLKTAEKGERNIRQDRKTMKLETVAADNLPL